MAARIVCFGELLLRLSAPGREQLLQSLRLDVHFGGAEANVAVSLARFGHDAAMVSVLPENPLGRACLGELRRQGVDVKALRFTPGRMGLYFMATGALQRPSDIVYDRADSAFALAEPDGFDWDRQLDGADWFHLSGITPAVGPRSAESALRAVKKATEKGIRVSFDCNYRSKLWQAWGGDARSCLKQIMSHAELVFGDHRDIALILGHDTGAAPAEERFANAARAAFAAFPRLRYMAATDRVTVNVDHHDMSGALVSRDAAWKTESYALVPIVDRIGGGDAFAAGLIHGLVTGIDPGEALRLGVAAACLKHSIPGDFNLVELADVQAFLESGGLDVRR